MNNLNNPNLKETIISTIQELKAQNPNFFTEPCRLLTWKSKAIEGALITKVNGQRYLGLLRKDIKGQDYWKYKPLKESNSGNSEEPNLNQPVLDNIAKFKERQEQTQNYVNNANPSKE